jgi:hypothetical protein
LGSKAPDNDDPSLLNFVMVVSWIGHRMSFLPMKYWLHPGKSDGPVFMAPDAGLATSVFSHEDIESNF